MLICLENEDEEGWLKLFEYAKQLNLDPELVDDKGKPIWLPGKPLTPFELRVLVRISQNSGTISMEEAFKQIREELDRK